MKSEQEIQAMLDDLEEDVRLTEYSVALVQVNAPLALEQVSLHAEASLLRYILGLPHRQYHGRDEQQEEPVKDEKDVTTTVLNAPVEKIDLDEAYCPNCGPNHALSNGGVGTRNSSAHCDVCDWEGTNGDLMDLLTALDSDDDL